LCAHAGFGDTLLHSWQGMSAQKALGRPEAPTQLAGMSLFLTDRVEPAAFAKLMEFPHLLSDEVDKLDAVAKLLKFPDIVRHPVNLLALAKLLEFPGMVPHVMSLLRTHDISFPITIGSQLKISLPNRGIPHGCLGRDSTITFRAMKRFHGKPWFDSMRYHYTMTRDGVEETGLGYGRCVCFVLDAAGEMYIVLRCYIPYYNDDLDTPARHVVETYDYSTQLAPLLLSRLDSIDSYMLVPVGALLNGGFILKDPRIKNKHWVIQGHREKEVFLNHNEG
jgi:hypothetical protein